MNSNSTTECGHSFTWNGIIAPSHCPNCGACLNPGGYWKWIPTPPPTPPYNPPVVWSLTSPSPPVTFIYNSTGA